MTISPIISIPILENKGLQSRISEHFGRTLMHMLVDPEGRIVAVLDQSANRPGEGSMPLAAMLDFGVTQIICTTIGRGAYDHLQAKALDVRVTNAKTVEKALAALKAGTLKAVTDEVLDANYKDDEGHGHGGGKHKGCGRTGEKSGKAEYNGHCNGHTHAQ